MLKFIRSTNFARYSWRDMGKEIVKGAVLIDFKVDKKKPETVDCSEEVAIAILLFSILN